MIAAEQSIEPYVSACLERMLASRLFAHAERQKRLLRYLVETTLAGKTGQLKGYTIGVEVFDRTPDFDPALDAIVRVQAGQLRAKLREYYEGEGRADPVRFELPKGCYTMRIVPLETDARDPAAGQNPRAPHPFRPTTGNQAAFPRPTLIEDKPSLAVLPFTNWSSDPEQEYFADGITEDLTTELSRLSGLFVISRHSAFTYKGVARRVEEIGAELGVRYLLEGSVRRCDRQVRISAQLIDATSGVHVWAERYDRELKDIFEVQDDVTRRIVDVLQVKLAGAEAERIGVEGTASVEAYDLLLRGRERFSICTREASREAKTFYKKALEIDPHYAAAHAWLARSHVFDWSMNWEQNPCVLETALEHVLKAVELDGRLALAYAVLGWTQLWRRQGNAAIANCRQAIALNPNNADARLFLSMSLVVSAYGEEALTQIQVAMRLNPHPTMVYLFALGECYYVLGEYDQAIAAYERGTQLNPGFRPNWASLAVMYTLAGRTQDAQRAREKAMQLSPVGHAPSTFYIDEALIGRYERDWKLAWGE